MFANIPTRLPRVRGTLPPPIIQSNVLISRYLVYASDMPKRLPILLVFRKLVQQFFSLVVFSVRTILVACIWLAVLPWITLWTWRAYFAVGDVACVFQ